MLLASGGILHAQAPPEVTGLQIDLASNLTWDPAPGADDYNVYRGLISWLAAGNTAKCHGDEIAATSFTSPANPGAGEGYFYLVTAESNTAGEGTPGAGSTGVPHLLRGGCDAVAKTHVLNRVGYGWDEWARDRVAALGLQGYINEQLDPASIDESGNSNLNTRRAALVPPDTIQELQGLDVVNAVYARRQLEQQVTLFWDNHFNTDYRESYQFFGFYQTLFPATRFLRATALHYDLQNTLRDLAFNGNIREMVEAVALSPAMILYLDTAVNVKSAPNENFARELLELHTMSVDGGYTQADIVQLAKVFTGWNVCKKDASVAGDPLAVCIPRSTYGTTTEPAGLWVNNFRTNQHDTTQKVLFAGTPYQAIIPDTTANPSAGVDDVQIALDAIVAHPATARFISTKLLQKFVAENPTQQMIDAVVAVWNNAANPHGMGDLRAVLGAVLAQSAFHDPDKYAGKIKTPFEHVVSGFRAARGRTDGVTVSRTYLLRMQEQFHLNPVPTGYSELGGDWLDTNNMLERLNFGLDMTSKTGNNFGADVIGLLTANGISTAPVPNNAPAIVDFYSGALFGGALTPAERQLAIDYLSTNDLGAPANYDDARIREAYGFMMGFAQFLEQ
jgi:uncharacterized protein (DUF1800 family)